MNLPYRLLRSTLRRLWAPSLSVLFVLPVLAQQVQPPAPPAPAAEDEAAAARQAAAIAASSSGGAALESKGEVVELSPFVVSADNNGYKAFNTMSGTRLNSKLEDLASSISIVTKQQMLDTAAVDINDIFSNESSTEGIYQYTDFTIDRGFTVDNVAQTPETSNRIRGVGSANLSRGGFNTSRQVPVDTYNLDSVEISRGPNTNIFGLGGSAGTVNLITGRANLTKDVTTISFRGDNRDSYRSTIDLNRVLIKDRLAVRVAGLYDHTEFERKPSLDKTNRLTASLSARPFKSTTIRASYESYHNWASRANSTTPRDTITEWRAAGSPVWDPTFNGVGGWRLLDGTTYTQVAANQEVALLPRGINPNFTNFWNRPSLFVNPDGSVGLYTVNRSALPPTGTNLPSPGQANSQLRFQQIGTAIQRGGGVFGVPLSPLFQQPGVTDRSIYDWENNNFAAPNFTKKKADIYQFELEQWIVNTPVHQLAVQAGYLKEDIDVRSRAFIGASDGAPPVIQVDINEKLLDGTPNPYFLQPYFGGSEMQTFQRPELNTNSRATLAYQLDLTQQDGWLKWIGRHNVAVYGEFRENVFASNSNGLRYRDQIISNESFHTAANLTNLPGRGPDNRFFTRYYVGGPVNLPGSVIDTANLGPLAHFGTQTFRWFNAATGQWVNDQVEIGEAYFALGKQKTELRTRGITWQAFLFDERIIPTVGFRRDKQRSVNNVAVPLRADGFLNTDFLDIFDNNWRNAAGNTDTQGVVVRPFANWSGIERAANEGNFLAGFARSLRVHYNQSDSFQPAQTATNLFGEFLPDPTGKGKDYGFSFSMFHDKLTVKFNKFETFDTNSRSGSTAVLATRPLRLDFDTSGANAVFGTLGGDSQDLQDNATVWVTSLHPEWTVDQQKTEVFRIMGLTEEFVSGIQNQPAISDINDVSSKGKEIEIFFNPNRYWTVKATVTQNNAVDLNLSPFISQYVEQRLPVWTTVRIPTDPLPNGTLLPNAGQLWWDVGAPNATGTSIPKNFFAVNVDAPFALATTNAGKPRPQTREWRANLTTNYKLAGLGGDHRWLKNLSVGGTVRWEDKATVGFFGAAPDPDGAVRRLDGSKPIFDQSRFYADLMASYNFKLFKDRVAARVQLNVRNVLEDGRLQAVSFNPDGTPWNFRIIDPRQFILTVTFDL